MPWLTVKIKKKKIENLQTFRKNLLPPFSTPKPPPA